MPAAPNTACGRTAEGEHPRLNAANPMREQAGIEPMPANFTDGFRALSPRFPVK
jgi:hypothetical protein